MNRKSSSFVLVILLLIAGSAVRAAGQTASNDANGVKAIRFGRLVDGVGKAWKGAIVLVTGDRVSSVVTDPAQIPPGAEIIDLRPYVGIPGLIDAHTHMTYYWDEAPGTNAWRQSNSRMAAVTVFLAQNNARKTLESGVTTVRDLGAYEYMDVAMRDLINRGAMKGPRMFVSGYGLGLHWPLLRPGYARPRGGRAEGVPEVMRVVREQIYGAGVDLVKVFSSDVVGTGTYRQYYTFEEMKAAVDVTHHAGKRIAIHAYGPSATRDAVRAGADSIEHGDDLEDTTLR